jgi:hypothetical protein
VGRAQVFGTRFTRGRGISTARDDGSIVVVELLAEGGGYTILGRVATDGAWRFKVDGYDMTPALIDEEPIVRRGDWVPTLQDVIGQISRGWYRRRAQEVHPMFQTALLAEVTQRMLNHIAENGELAPRLRDTYRRWQKVCGVRGNYDEEF